jgi:hypothetical protein
MLSSENQFFFKFKIFIWPPMLPPLGLGRDGHNARLSIAMSLLIRARFSYLCPENHCLVKYGSSVYL